MSSEREVRAGEDWREKVKRREQKEGRWKKNGRTWRRTVDAGEAAERERRRKSGGDHGL